MGEHLKKRPKKKIFQKEKIDFLRNKAIDKIKVKFLPDEKIIKIILIGSSVKNTFGEYEKPGFRGSLFSDFDFIIFVEDNYGIPKWLDKEPDGKPFPNDKLNLAYRSKNFLENMYDVEVFFVRRKTMENPEIENLAEMPGCEIPFSEKSKWKQIVVYSKNEY
ncbi:hypothetical protein CL617_05125 [archaeon]|nr:hypothetical protein [archaeon]|tara:strand:- start:1307 stop:1792 length:486 start_codon:yes stop_codon:yes gene_type:complete